MMYLSSGVQTFSDTDIISTFTSAFSSFFTVITENPALLLILCVAVGLPILGGVIALFKR